MQYTRLRSVSMAVVIASILFAANAANACQLVCIVIPYSPAPDSTAARNAACTAARAGFKPAVKGMLSALPGDVSDFHSPINGMACATNNGVVGLANAIYDSTPFSSTNGGVPPGLFAIPTWPLTGSKPAFNAASYFGCPAPGSSAELICCNM